MSTDLEEQLQEMEPKYRAVVARLRGARCVSPSGVSVAGGARRLSAPWAAMRWPCRWAAAVALVLLGVAAVFFSRADRRVCAARPACLSERDRTAGNGPREYMLARIHTDDALREMIRTQNPDGSWQNDFLTRQNAAALKTCDRADACVAYKKAVRNLRAKGLL